MEDFKEIVPIGVEKKSVERSVAYPSIGILESLDIAEKIYKRFGFDSFKREDVAIALDSTSLGAYNRHVAALVHYGVAEKVEKQINAYKLSKWYKDVRNPINEEEKRQNLILAFKNPKLYTTLIEKYQGEEVPAALETILIRNHGITESAAAQAAKVFIDNARDIGVLGNDNVLHISNEISSFYQSPIETAPEESSINNISVQNIPLQLNASNTRFEVKPNAKIIEEEILITKGNSIRIQYPNVISLKDLDIFRKHIDLIELRLQIEKDED